MTIPQDLADRLEKAIADCDKFGTAYGQAISRTQLIALMVDNAPTILASLRRSAPASGETRTALASAIRVAAEARKEWDMAPSSMKAGKLLIALSGHLPGYRADIDAIHAALPPPATRRARRQDREQR